MTAETRVALLDQKRRFVADYAAASEELREALAGASEPDPEVVGPHLERREEAVEAIRRLDARLDATPSTDHASEIVVGAALRRSIEEALYLDAEVQEALKGWRDELAASLGGLSRGRKSLGGYSTPDRTRPRLVYRSA